MEIIFYLLLLIPIIYELLVLKDTEVVFNFFKSFDKLKSKDKKTSNQQVFSYFMMFYVFLNIIGLFTVNYIYFIILLIFSILFDKKEIDVKLLKLDAFLSLIVLIFIVLNKVHFHIYF